MADSDTYLKQLEDDYDEPRRIRKFFARKPPPMQQRGLLRANLGGGASVSIALAAGQGNPVNAGPVNFTVTFSEAATGFTNADVVTSASTVGGTLAVAVTGTGPAYNVAVTGMTGNGGVTINIPAGSATTTAKGLPFPASNAATVVFDTARPSVTVAAAAGQADPASTSPITFTVTFSETVVGFVAADVVITGTAGGTKVVTLSGNNAQVTGMTAAGTVIGTVPVNAVTDLAGNLSTVSNSATVQWTPLAPAVTINKAAGQASPTAVSPILYTVIFSEAVTGFATGDVSFSGTSAGGTLVGTVSGGPTTYTVSVTGMTTSGSVIAQIPANIATSLPGVLNLASTSTGTDNIVAWQPDVTAPTVTINQGASQVDPTSGSSIVFDVVFSEPVSAITSGSVNVTFGCGGTPSVSVTTLTSSTYTVTVSGMAAPNGNVTASIPAGVTFDAASNLNTASTSTDNIVAWMAPTGGFPDNTTSGSEFPILFI